MSANKPLTGLCVESIEQTIHLAEQRCKENGTRLTDKRKNILTLLLKSGKAQSAYELIESYKAELGTALSAMSVYRFLAFLEQEHLVHKLELANKYVACEHIGCEHGHAVAQFLICRECQKVKEISINQSIIAEIKRSVSESGFRLLNQHLEMHCVCDECSV